MSICTTNSKYWLVSYCYSRTGPCLKRNCVVHRYYSSCKQVSRRSSNKTVVPSASIPRDSTVLYLLILCDAIEILQLSREAFWNLIGTANPRAAEVNSLDSFKLPGLGTRLCLHRHTDFLMKQLSSEWTVGQLTIHEWGWQRQQTSVMIECSSFCGPLGILLVLILVWTVSRTVVLILAFSSCAHLDSGCVCACSCVGMRIYVCESLKLRVGLRMWSWIRDSTFN